MQYITPDYRDVVIKACQSVVAQIDNMEVCPSDKHKEKCIADLFANEFKKEIKKSVNRPGTKTFEELLSMSHEEFRSYITMSARYICSIKEYKCVSWTVKEIYMAARSYVSEMCRIDCYGHSPDDLFDNPITRAPFVIGCHKWIDSSLRKRDVPSGMKPSQIQIAEHCEPEPSQPSHQPESAAIPCVNETSRRFKKAPVYSAPKIF